MDFFEDEKDAYGEQRPDCLRINSLELPSIVSERRDRVSKLKKLNQMGKQRQVLPKQKAVQKNVSDSEDSGEDEKESRNYNFTRNASVLVAFDQVYLNKMTLSHNDSLKTVINFRLAPEDLSSKFLFRYFTRDIAHDCMRHANTGDFLVRPSSRRGHYAITWVEEGKIKDKIIYNHFPGYGLTRQENDRHLTLCELVEANKHFLKTPLAPQEYSVTAFALHKKMSEVMMRLSEQLKSNTEELKTLEWQLCVLEDPTIYAKLEDCERRTYIVYGGKVQVVLPECFDVQPSFCKSFCDGLAQTLVLTQLSLKGFEGVGRRNCVSVLSDDVFVKLCAGLRTNRSLVELDVSFNEIKDTGAAAFAGVLLDHKRLALCDLSHNYITGKGLKDIVQSVRENMVIDELILDHQMVGVDLQGLPRISVDAESDLLIGALQNAFKRKVELLRGGLPFSFFISEKKAEELLYGREFVLYLNPCKPDTLQIAYKVYGKALHRTIYRVNDGYSFHLQDNEGGNVPSLSSYASWSFMSQNFDADVAQFPHHIVEDLLTCKTLFHLWRVEDVDVESKRQGRTFPTLLYLVTSVQQEAAKKRTSFTKMTNSGTIFTKKSAHPVIMKARGTY